MTSNRGPLAPGFVLGTYPDCCEGSELSLLQVVALTAGEELTNEPECCCPVIGSYAADLCGSVHDQELRAQVFLPLVPQLTNSKATADITTRRGLACLDWLIRDRLPGVMAAFPTWADDAATLVRLPKITMESACLASQSLQRILVSHPSPAAAGYEHLREMLIDSVQPTSQSPNMVDTSPVEPIPFYLHDVVQQTLDSAGIDSAYHAIHAGRYSNVLVSETASKAFELILYLAFDTVSTAMRETAPWEPLRSTMVEASRAIAELAVARFETELLPWSEMSQALQYSQEINELTDQEAMMIGKIRVIAPRFDDAFWAGLRHLALAAAAKVEPTWATKAVEALSGLPRPLVGIVRGPDYLATFPPWYEFGQQAKAAMFCAARNAAWEAARIAVIEESAKLAAPEVLAAAVQSDSLAGFDFTKSLVIPVARERMTRLFPTPFESALRLLNDLLQIVDD